MSVRLVRLHAPALPLGMRTHEVQELAVGHWRTFHRKCRHVQGGIRNASWQNGTKVSARYARKIEVGRRKMIVPGHVYQDAALIVAGRYGNRVAVKFTFMPVRFGGVQAFAAFSRRLRPGRRMSEKARQDWLVRQPALEIRGR